MLSEYSESSWELVPGVLILVLVEYALWGNIHLCSGRRRVLILVLVEYALWAPMFRIWWRPSLNPCFSGICSLSNRMYPDELRESLNPCFSGICSLRKRIRAPIRTWCSLNPCFSGICSLRLPQKIALGAIFVLILVLVEYALWAAGDTIKNLPSRS